jgi:hypothetical protein
MIGAGTISGRRAIIKTDACPDIHFELHRTGFDFAIIENGRNVGVFWRALTPEEAKTGSSHPLTIDEAWTACLSKRFPGYEATNVEDAVIE